MTFAQTYGGDGDTPFDEEGYSNTIMNLNIYIEGSNRTASENRELMYNWFDTGKYIDFIPYFDPGKIYKVMPSSPPKFTSVYYMGEGQIMEIALTVKPYKYYIPIPDIVLTDPATIYNPMLKTSLPKFKIYGTGDVTLSINGVPFVIKDIDGHVVIDSQLGIAYNEANAVLVNKNNKIFTKKYPVLNPGMNSISWEGSVSSIVIEPRWRTLT